MNTHPPKFLQDKVFLQALDSLHIKEQYIKITVLNWKEEPLQQIQGIVISGNVNMDGSSLMRRTATLSIFAEEKENNLANVDHLFAINKKCTIQLGIKNKVNDYIFTSEENGKITRTVINYKQMYGDIIWFPLGLYVMFNPSIAHGMDGVTISMQLKDKMCLLNGDLGGQIHSAVDFTSQDQEVDADSLSIEQNPTLIYNIIKQLVNHWGNEILSKIIIADVPLWAKKAVRVNGTTIYYIQDQNNDNLKLYLNKEERDGEYNKYTDKINVKAESYQDGEDIGYEYTPFTFPGELSCNAGETVTSVLDKIIGVIGNYQYFYDVFGNFIFQEKKNYLNTTHSAYWQQHDGADTGVLPSSVYQAQKILTKPVYDFTNNEYTSAYNNKNDFVVWGSRQSGSSSQQRTGCRFHLAIDKKPETGQNHDIALYKDSFQVVRAVAWQDKYKPVENEDGSIELTELFPNAKDEKARGKIYARVTARVSTDWRQEIYYQMCQSEILGTDTNTELNNTYFQYYAELKEQFPKIFDLSPADKELDQKDFVEIIDNQEADGWKVTVKDYPYTIDYFLDFIDENSQLGQYSVGNIGRRAKIIEDNNEGINCVFEPQIPDVIFVTSDQNKDEDFKKMMITSGQMWSQIGDDIAFYLTIGGTMNSCYEKVKDLLYQYSHMNNSISITTLPIYYLEPNTRITVEDKPAGIYGDYIIQSISLPLDVSSTMSINAYKALQKI